MNPAGNILTELAEDLDPPATRCGSGIVTSADALAKAGLGKRGRQWA
jgi:hypothetical protein